MAEGDLKPEPKILSFQDMPEEVRGKILNYLTQTETQIQTVRLVCKLWDQTVKEYYKYEVNRLNDTSPEFEGRIKHRISHLGIQKLDTISVLKPDGTCIFEYPGAIRHLVCSRYGSSISPANVQILLGLLSKTLCSLEIELIPAVYHHEFPSDLSYNFQALTQLKLLCLDTPAHLDQAPSLLRVLEASTFPKLRAFKLHFWHGDFVVVNGTIVGHALRLVGANGKSLESLNLQIRGRDLLPLRREYLKLGPSDLAALKSIHTLKEYIGNCWATDPSDLDPQDLNFSKYLLPNNSAGLVSIKLLNLRLKASMDLSVFESCSNLMELLLHGSHPPAVNYCFNFHRIPETIISLRIIRLKVASRELLAALSPPENGTDGKFLRQLQTLVLCETGHGDSFGFSPEALERVLTSESLVKLTVSENVGSLQSPFDVELQNFSAIFTKLNYNRVEEYLCTTGFEIQLGRNNPANRWEQIGYMHK